MISLSVVAATSLNVRLAAGDDPRSLQPAVQAWKDAGADVCIVYLGTSHRMTPPCSSHWPPRLPRAAELAPVVPGRLPSLRSRVMSLRYVDAGRDGHSGDERDAGDARGNVPNSIRGTAVALTTIAAVAIPVTSTALEPTVCDQAIAQAGTGQGTYGNYRLVRGPERRLGVAGRCRHTRGRQPLRGFRRRRAVRTRRQRHPRRGSGNDYVDGGAGDDTVQGGSGDDVVNGGPGLDRAFGGSGNDTIRNSEITDGGSGVNQNPPFLDELNPNRGPVEGGTVVTVEGNFFDTAPGATTIKFGDVAATNVSCTSSRQCTVTSPPGSVGVVDVTATTAAGTSDAFPFVYT